VDAAAHGRGGAGDDGGAGDPAEQSGHVDSCGERVPIL
jgi:hypothetical protein